MKNRQLVYLFLTNFVIYFIGMGLMPVLPLYTSRFGATPTVVGVYLALIYVSIAAGTMLTGWLSARLTRKRLFVGAGALGVPALVLLGQATALWQVVLLTGVVWFSGGIGTALVSIYTGLYADSKSRGKSFSLMFLALPLASLVGGLSVGQLVTWQGYPLMFAVLAGVWAGWPLIGLLGLKDEQLGAPARAAAASGWGVPRLGRAFYLVLAVALLSATAIYVTRIGTSLSMQALSFSPRAVASTTAVGGLVTIPITLLVGTLSDRLGRKAFLILSYLVAAVGAAALAGATQLWHFWLASALLFMARSANGSVAAAYATDLLPPQSLGRGLPWLNSMSWLAGIVGSAGAGYLMDAAGAASVSFIAAALSVAAAALIGLPWASRKTALPARPAWAEDGCVPQPCPAMS